MTGAGSERVRVATVVGVEPAEAFRIFTEETDLWWKRGPRFRFGGDPDGVVAFEGGADGRLVLSRSAGAPQEIGRVRVWEPAARLVFDWRGPDYAPDERTEVEVSFTPTVGGTRVTVEHRRFETLRADHPSRRGLEGEAFTSMIGLFWGDLATALRAHARGLHRR